MRLLDLFCGGGGAGEGYRQAGFEVTGVDIAPQKNNPHTFIQADALKPWIIENVPGAPMRPDFKLCGCQFGLKLRRERWFETSWVGFDLRPACHHPFPVVSVVGHGTPSWVREQLGYNPTIHDYREAMGINWMNRNELSQAIPPAYTEYIGRILKSELLTAHTK